MHHWFLKSEPTCYSWDEMTRDRMTVWDGVRNYQARNHLKSMKKGDLAFFYHSGDERQVVGVVEIVREFYPDPTTPDPQWGVVDVRFVESMKKPVTLTTMKLVPELSAMSVLKQGRLSVSPVTKDQFEMVMRLGGMF